MRLITQCTGGSVGLRAGLGGFVNPAPSGVRTPDRPAHSESLYNFVWAQYNTNNEIIIIIIIIIMRWSPNKRTRKGGW
jgi:hypothetical protein